MAPITVYSSATNHTPTPRLVLDRQSQQHTIALQYLPQSEHTKFPRSITPFKVSPSIMAVIRGRISAPLSGANKVAREGRRAGFGSFSVMMTRRGKRLLCVVTVQQFGVGISGNWKESREAPSLSPPSFSAEISLRRSLSAGY